MTYDDRFVGRRPVGYGLRDGREVFVGELVEDRSGVTFRSGTVERSGAVVADALARLEGLRGDGAPPDPRHELAAAFRGLLLAMPYGERTPAFAEALVLGVHLAVLGEPFRLPRDVRGEIERAAWTSVGLDDFGAETALTPSTEPRALTHEDDGGV
jgi:hypothetical protein